MNCNAIFILAYGPDMQVMHRLNAFNLPQTTAHFIIIKIFRRSIQECLHADNKGLPRGIEDDDGEEVRAKRIDVP